MIKEQLIIILKDCIDKSGLTQQQIGELNGVSKQRINNLKRGEGGIELITKVIESLGYQLEIKVSKIL